MRHPPNRGVLLMNSCQASEAHASSSLSIATAIPKAAPIVGVVPSLDVPDLAVARFLRAFYSADYRQRDRYLCNVIFSTVPIAARLFRWSPVETQQAAEALAAAGRIQLNVKVSGIKDLQLVTQG